MSKQLTWTNFIDPYAQNKMTIKLTFDCQQPKEIAFSIDPNLLTMTSLTQGTKGVNAQQMLVCWNSNVIIFFRFYLHTVAEGVPVQ